MDHRTDYRNHLELAQRLVASYFESHDCPWQGRFHADEQQCRCCAESAPCKWLFGQDVSFATEQMTTDELRVRLLFAVGYLEGRMLDQKHETASCNCAVCTWVRNCQVLFGDAVDGFVYEVH